MATRKSGSTFVGVDALKHSDDKRKNPPCANITCATYPREISEQRGRYDDQPAIQGPNARSEGFFRSGRIARSP